MPEPDKSTRPQRRYPAIYEKLIPVVLAIIALATVAALAFAAVVALRWLPGIVY